MGRTLVWCVALAAAPALLAQGTVNPPAVSYQPMTAEERIEFFVEGSLASPQALFRSALAGSFAHLNDTPPEWGQGADGYGRRYASTFGTLLIRDGVESAGAALLKQDPRYERCRCSGFFPRFGHAVAARFITRNNKGKKRFAFARVGGQFAAGMATVAWYPERYNYGSDGLRFGTRLLGFGTITNLVQEFVVEPRR